jgi:hypothetical protein
VPSKNLFRHSQFSADQANLILKQLAQRLDQFQVHLLGQATNIVMALDHSRWTTHRNRFDHVRIERSLDQVTYVAEAARLFLKHVDEYFTDALPLLLGVDDTFKRREKQLSRANSGDVQLHALSQQRQRCFKLPFPQQPVVDKDTGLPISDGLVHEGGSDS